LLGLLFAFSGSSVLSTTVFGPIEKREDRVTNIKQNIQQLESEQAVLKKARRDLKKWSHSSLPRQESVASTLYQNWLIELAGETKLLNTVVTPNKTSPQGDAYVRLPFTVQAETGLDRLCNFLYGFYKADLLHKITRVQIESTDNTKNPNLRVTVQLEALALQNAEPRFSLFSALNKEDKVAEILTHARTHYDPIVSRNLFVRGYRAPKKVVPAVKRRPIAKAKQPSKPKLDVAQHVYLVASLEEANGEREAWLYNRTSNEQIVLQEGVAFEAADVTGLVLAIGANFILFEAEGATKKLELGQSLRQLTTVSTDERAQAN